MQQLVRFVGVHENDCVLAVGELDGFDAVGGKIKIPAAGAAADSRNHRGSVGVTDPDGIFTLLERLPERGEKLPVPHRDKLAEFVHVNRQSVGDKAGIAVEVAQGDGGAIVHDVAEPGSGVLDHGLGLAGFNTGLDFPVKDKAAVALPQHFHIGAGVVGMQVRGIGHLRPFSGRHGITRPRWPGDCRQQQGADSFGGPDRVNEGLGPRLVPVASLVEGVHEEIEGGFHAAAAVVANRAQVMRFGSDGFHLFIVRGGDLVGSGKHLFKDPLLEAGIQSGLIIRVQGINPVIRKTVISIYHLRHVAAREDNGHDLERGFRAGVEPVPVGFGLEERLERQPGNQIVLGVASIKHIAVVTGADAFGKPDDLASGALGLGLLSGDPRRLGGRGAGGGKHQTKNNDEKLYEREPFHPYSPLRIRKISGKLVERICLPSHNSPLC